MKKLLAVLIAGLFAAGAFAQTPSYTTAGSHSVHAKASKSKAGKSSAKKHAKKSTKKTAKHA